MARTLEEELQIISEAGLEWSISAKGRGFDSRYEIRATAYIDGRNHSHDLDPNMHAVMILANTKSEEEYVIGTFELKIIVDFLTEILKICRVYYPSERSDRYRLRMPSIDPAVFASLSTPLEVEDGEVERPAIPRRSSEVYLPTPRRSGRTRVR